MARSRLARWGASAQLCACHFSFGNRLANHLVVYMQHWLTDEEVNSVMSQYDQDGAPAPHPVSGHCMMHLAHTSASSKAQGAYHHDRRWVHNHGGV
jgi:hypothetical protein